MNKVTLKEFLIYAPKEERKFHCYFGDHLTIIHGRNTSGKSTLIQSIIYSLGINYGKENLQEINKEETVFRLDCELEK